MCGLFGFFTNNPAEKPDRRANIVKLGLINSMARGDDATGIAYQKVGQKAEYMKRAEPADIFCNYAGYERAMTDINKFKWLIGHTRAATNGSYATASKEAHPFATDNFILAHNGYIRNHMALEAEITNINVDSSKVCASMELNGETETLIMLEGSYALTWYNNRDNTLNFAKNDDRPLYFSYLDDENTLYWASRYEMLHWIFVSQDAAPKGKYMKYDSHIHVKLDVESGKITLLPYKPDPLTAPRTAKAIAEREKHAVNPRTPAGGNATALLTGPKATPSATIGTIHTGRIRGNEEVIEVLSKIAKESDGSDVATMRKMEAALGISSIRLQSAPSSPTQMREVSIKLHSFGLRIGQIVQMSTDSWTPYNSKQTGDKVYGAVRGKIHLPLEQEPIKPFVFGVCHGVSYTTWDKSTRDRCLICKVSNITSRSTPANSNYKIYEIVVEHDHLLHASIMASKKYTSERDIHEEEPLDLIRGPDGVHITKSQWDRLTKEGCGNCMCDILEEHAERILWQGDAPICSGCQEQGYVGAGAN